MRSLVCPFLCAMLCFGGCTQKEDIAGFSRNFFLSLSDTTYGQPKDYYPLYSSLNLSAKSDVVDINESEIIEHKDSFVVKCLNSFSDRSGNFRQDSVQLFIAKDSLNHLFIYDSKGFVDTDEDTKWFAKVTGALKNSEPNDLELAKIYETVQSMLFSEYLDVKLKLIEQVKISNWSWETSDYSGEPRGEGRVINNMNMSISDIKYHIYYYDYDGDFMAEDEGSIHKTLYPGEKYNFSFWSNNAKNPKTARLELSFSDKNIFDVIKRQPYKGNEYQVYVAKYK